MSMSMLMLPHALTLRRRRCCALHRCCQRMQRRWRTWTKCRSTAAWRRRTRTRTRQRTRASLLLARHRQTVRVQLQRPCPPVPTPLLCCTVPNICRRARPPLPLPRPPQAADAAGRHQLLRLSESARRPVPQSHTRVTAAMMPTRMKRMKRVRRVAQSLRARLWRRRR